MKRFFTILAALACTLSAFAQTPEDIISNMEDVFTEHDNGGLFMVVDVKIPILGTMSSKVWNFGDKTCVEGSMMDVKIISWSDKTTDWTYDSKNNLNNDNKQCIPPIFTSAGPSAECRILGETGLHCFHKCQRRKRI